MRATLWKKTTAYLSNKTHKVDVALGYSNTDKDHHHQLFFFAFECLLLMLLYFVLLECVLWGIWNTYLYYFLMLHNDETTNKDRRQMIRAFPLKLIIFLCILRILVYTDTHWKRYGYVLKKYEKLINLNFSWSQGTLNHSKWLSSYITCTSYILELLVLLHKILKWYPNKTLHPQFHAKNVSR